MINLPRENSVLIKITFMNTLICLFSPLLACIIFVFFKVSFVRLIFMYMCTHLSGIACGGQKRVLDSLLNMEVMN